MAPHRQQSRKKVMAKKGRPGEKKRRSKVVNENNEMVRLDDGWKEERGGNKAQRKPITPADMAGLYSKNKKIPTLKIDDDVSDRKSMTYESLLSPDARKALDDARSWRSKQHSLDGNEDNHDVGSEDGSEPEDDDEPKESARTEQAYEDEDFEEMSVADSQRSARVHNNQDEESVEEDMDMLLAGLTEGN
mmetsp:Transcript_38748/g.122084  ORF Transcript_38748/g.122084 Transcript_38748/m.122084 type:complete len:190 (-) Transcript_38748:47-616(-)